VTGCEPLIGRLVDAVVRNAAGRLERLQGLTIHAVGVVGLTLSRNGGASLAFVPWQAVVQLSASGPRRDGELNSVDPTPQELVALWGPE
jgi:hypothetical protein